MKVIEGKQIVLQPYLTEAQCVKSVSGHTPRQAQTDMPRIHTVRSAGTRPPQTRELAAEKAMVTDSHPVLVHAASAEVQTGRTFGKEARKDLTLGQLFASAECLDREKGKAQDE